MRKVLLAEDHAIVIRGIKIIFESEFRDCMLDVVKSTTDLMKALRQSEYDLALLDLQLEDGDTLHLVATIRNLHPRLNILVFSANPEEIYAKHLFNEGIKGYINKQATDDEIIAAVSTCLDGKKYISEKYKNFLLNQKEQPESGTPLQALSAREMEIANLLQQGKKTNEICEELNLHSSTVATHKNKIFSKLNVTNVIELKELFKTQNFFRPNDHEKS